MNTGLKRKLSFEDFASRSPPSSTPATSLASSSQGSSAQPQARPENAGTRATPLNNWNIAGAPYFNSRTRKRLRDSRPSEDAVHERTLQKLYSAQKTLQQGAESDGSRQTASHSNSPDTPRHPQYHANAQLISGPPVQVEITPERNQRSIDVFFPGSRPGSLRTASSSTSIPQTTAVLQPPLPSSTYQPNDTAPSLIHPHPYTLPSVLTCEDCYAPLLTKQSSEAIDAEMLDVDMLANLVDPEIDEGWQCAVCGKRTCNACAVRGDYRVCLECAVPGGGRYEERELNQKRWVGGIGWM
jgi:hypothetical protein